MLLKEHVLIYFSFSVGLIFFLYLTNVDLDRGKEVRYGTTGVEFFFWIMK